MSDCSPTERRYLGAMLDCGHATKDFVGHSALEFYQRHHQIVEYVEFKDWSPATDLRTEVGRGTCDFTGLAQALKEHHYGGWICGRAERHGPHAQGELRGELPLHP